MTTQDQIHQWMDENAYNYVSSVDNTINEAKFLRDVEKVFAVDEVSDFFWAWEGWGEG